MNDMTSKRTETNKTVWIVDDDEAILEAVQAVVEEEGYDTIAFKQVGPLHKELLMSKPDLILLDILLSGADGRTVCKEIKNNSDTKDIKVVLMSANSNLEKDTIDSRADSYIKKPFDIDELIHKIETNLSLT
jgi:DNA-binding response OmpR family regulator